VVAVVERVPPSTSDSSPNMSLGPISHNRESRGVRSSAVVERVSFTFPSTTRYRLSAESPASKITVFRGQTDASHMAMIRAAEAAPRVAKNGWVAAVATTFAIRTSPLMSTCIVRPFVTGRVPTLWQLSHSVLTPGLDSPPMLSSMAASPSASRPQREDCRACANEVRALLANAYPDAHCELNYAGPYQLLVATVLSAQTTDRRVNTVTPTLFNRWPGPPALADADIGDGETVVAPLGCGPTRAARLVSLGAKLVDNFDGAIPDDLDSLVTLPGVGRKTANVVLGNAFGIPGITPDTHVMRVSRRLGWTDATTPAKVETDLAELFDPSECVMFCHRLIWHGRRRCHSRRPACGVCPVAEWCPSFGEGPTDPEEAATLVREPRR